MQGVVRWLFVPLSQNDRALGMTNNKNDSSVHGSCMVSKAAGALYGVTKKSDVVIVQRAAERVSYVLDSLNRIFQDVIARNVQRAVLCLALGESI